MSEINGTDTKAYYGNAGAEASTELTGIVTDSLDDSAVEADVTTKGVAVKQYATVMHDLPVSFTILFDTANAGHTALRTAYQNKTLISLLFLEGPKNVAGNKGFGGDFTVTQFKRGAPIEGKVTYDVVAKPGRSTAYPVTWRESSGS